MSPILSEKQEALLGYLRRQVNETGEIPSLRRVAQDLDISHTAVLQQLRILERKGFIRREGRYSRNIYLLNQSGETAAIQRGREVPIIGRIAAGLPLYAQQEWEGAVLVDSSVFNGSNLFALRVRGDSMVEVGILDGDLVICEPRQFARNGEIVVALIGDEATVKLFFLHEDRIELRPANQNYSPRNYGLGEVLIQGKVVGIQRGLEGIERAARQSSSER